jgi:hypothetical protein
VPPGRAAPASFSPAGRRHRRARCQGAEDHVTEFGGTGNAPTVPWSSPALTDQVQKARQGLSALALGIS